MKNSFTLYALFVETRLYHADNIVHLSLVSLAFKTIIVFDLFSKCIQSCNWYVCNFFSRDRIVLLMLMKFMIFFFFYQFHEGDCWILSHFWVI